MAGPGTLYLLPTTLGDNDPAQVLPATTVEQLRKLTYFIAENPKTARALLKRVGTATPLQEIRIERLDEHTPAASLPGLLTPLLQGQDGGLVSDAGCPAVADPGAPLVRLAHDHKVRVMPLVGPSSIMLALMASGLDGQRFSFHGYLPVEERQLHARLLELEKDSKRLSQTQIFIETPYRNERMLAAALRSLKGSTRMCIATDLTMPTESIFTATISDWRKAEPSALKDRPAVFLFLAN